MEKAKNYTTARSVSSNQEGIHKDLETVVQKYASSTFLRPVAEHTKQAFTEAESFIQKFYKSQSTETYSVILDSGCGTGESTLHLAERFPEFPIIGIDKSALRLSHFQNTSKPQSLPQNVFFVRAELLDFWNQSLKKVLEGKWSIPYHALYYPNPWPKQSEATRRFHMHPIFPTMMRLSPKTELRTNWEIYAREFATAAEILGTTNLFASLFPNCSIKISCSPFIAENPETAFERKYKEAHQQLWRVLVER